MPEKKIEIIEYQCSNPKCKHKWIPRKQKKPKVCPICKRTDWNK